MRANRARQKNILIAIVLLSLSLAACLCLVFNKPSNDTYRHLFILPFTFFIASIISISFIDIMFSRISILMVVGFYFFRMVILPCIMMYGSYSTFVNQDLIRNMDLAIVLMCYEMFTVFLLLAIMAKRLRCTDREIVLRKGGEICISKRFRLVIFVLLTYVIILLASNPSILRSNFFLLVKTPDTWHIDVQYARLGSSEGGTLGILVTLLNTVFWLLQAFLPPLMLKRIAKTRRSEGRKVLLSLIVVAVTMLIATETRAHSIECAMAVLIVMMNMYKKKVEKILPICVAALIIIVIYGLLEKSGVLSSNGISRNSINDMSRIFSAYFSGPQYVASGITAIKSVDNMSILNMPIDILRSIPYLGSIFSRYLPNSSNTLYNSFLSFGGKSTGQILPCICQGYQYFGFLLAPILPCLCVYLSVRFEIAARNTSNIVMKNCMLLFSIMIARCLMVNLISGVSTLCNIGLTYFIAKIAIDATKNDIYSLSSFKQKDHIFVRQ